MIFVSTSRFQKWFDVDILDLKFGLCFRYFGLFCKDYFWLLYEKLGNFSKTSGHPGQDKSNN
jgi:hypothetical protein